EAALHTIEDLEQVFSAYRPESEFRRWQTTHEGPVLVSPHLAHVLARAEHYRAASDNLFLPIADALRNEWKAGTLTEPYRDPSPLWTV
ncbi:FAD:protein FMN transferase, partial [Acinetobacter baumannii]